MAQPERTFTLPRRADRHRDPEREQLLQTLAQTRVLINQAYSGFNSAKDQDLIESFVFEINALQSRYSYLLRQVKEGGASAAPTAYVAAAATKGGRACQS